MPLIGNQLGSAENNSFRVLDDISNFTLPFDGSSSSVVSATNDTITLFQHPFVTGQRVTYSSGSGTQIGGLTSGSAYFINKVDANSFKLSTTYAGSLQNTNLVDIIAPGTGITHTFNVRFDGINTKFKATYNNGTKCSISRAAQLDIAVNGVVQQPYDSNPPPNGFTIEADATIVFSTPPLVGFTFWGKALTNAIASFETSDNSIDTFTGNGSSKNFTLSKTPANSQNVLVTINGVLQYPSDSSAIRSYSVNANVLSFDVAPANGSSIQVRYIGFAGATSSNVTGFYGRTGNVILTRSDNIAIGTAKIGPVVGVSTTLLVEGNARITGILTIGTSSITFDGTTDRLTVGNSVLSSTGVSTFSSGISLGTGTSISSPATNVLTLGTNNTEVVRVFSNGNIGINSTLPGYALDVRGAVRVAVAAGNTYVDIGGDGGRSIEIGAGGVTDTGPNCYLDFHGADATYPDYGARLIRSSGANGNFELSNRGTGSTNISTQDAGNVVLRTTGTDRVIVTSSGNFQYNNGYGSIATVYGVRAWVNFDGGSPTIRGSGNVSSVTKHGTGDHSVNFTNAMPDGNYSALFTGSGNTNSIHCNPYLWYIRNNYSTTSVSIGFFNDNNSNNRADQTYTTMVVIR